MSCRRGELIPDAETAMWMIHAGRSMMHGKCVLSARQVATWTAGKIDEQVKRRPKAIQIKRFSLTDSTIESEP